MSVSPQNERNKEEHTLSNRRFDAMATKGDILSKTLHMVGKQLGSALHTQTHALGRNGFGDQPLLPYPVTQTVGPLGCIDFKQ